MYLFQPSTHHTWQYCITGQQGCHNISAAVTDHLSARTLCTRTVYYMYDSYMIAQIIYYKPTAQFPPTTGTVHILNSHLHSIRIRFSAKQQFLLYISWHHHLFWLSPARHTYINWCAFLSKLTKALNVNIKKCCCFSFIKVIPAFTVKMKECCFHSQNIEALTSKLCFNSCT